jgi:hypothetical protein
MIERTSGEREHRTWTDAEIESIAAADTEFPPITEEDLARALAAPRRESVRGAAPIRVDPPAVDSSEPHRP